MPAVHVCDCVVLCRWTEILQKWSPSWNTYARRLLTATVGIFWHLRQYKATKKLRFDVISSTVLLSFFLLVQHVVNLTHHIRTIPVLYVFMSTVVGERDPQQQIFCWLGVLFIECVKVCHFYRNWISSPLTLAKQTFRLLWFSMCIVQISGALSGIQILMIAGRRYMWVCGGCC